MSKSKAKKTDKPNTIPDCEENTNLKISLKRLKVKDIRPSEAYDPAEEISEKRRGYIRVCLMLICICVFIGSAYSIISTLVGYSKAEQVYGDLLEEDIEVNSPYILTNENVTTPRFGSRISLSTGLSLDFATYQRMISRIKTLQAVNSEVIGWINIPGTKNINYPLMQAINNDYYLSHDYKGNYLAAGSIFLDYRCSKDFNENHNTVIYGHNMQNNMMFSEIIKFLQKDFFDENKYIYLYNEYGVYTYEIFSIYKTNYQYKYIETGFETHTEFVEFAYEMKENSLFVRDGIEFDENSRIITLSTCTNVLQTERYCLQAVLVDAYNN